MRRGPLDRRLFFPLAQIQTAVERAIDCLLEADSSPVFPLPGADVLRLAPGANGATLKL